MRKFLGTLVLLAIVVGVIGASRDWFLLERRTDGSNTEVHLHIDRDRIRSDTKNAAEAAKEIGQNIEKKFDE
jgi:hypothetical protein